MQQRFDTWQRGLRRAGCRVFAGFCLVMAVLQVRSLLMTQQDSDVRGAAVAGVVVLLAASVRAFQGRSDTKDAVAFTALLAWTAADPAPVAAAATGGDANPTFLVLAATLLVYIVVWSGVVVPLALIAAGVLYVGCAVQLAGRALAPALDETVLLVASDLAIWILFRRLQSEARRADEAHYRAITEQGVAARISAEQAVAINAQRTLHDRVLAVLLLLNTPTRHAPDRRLPSRPALREWCRRSAEAVRALGADVGVSGPTTALDLHARIARETAEGAQATGLSVEVHHAATDRPGSIPGQVADAISAAVAEALRNVGRHAGVDRAQVQLTSNPDGGVTVEVVDHGQGLPPGSTAGFGLRQAVSARLHEVGGTVTVDAPDGGGTRVALHWVPTDAAPDSLDGVPAGAAELTRVSRRPRGLATQFSAPLFLGTLYLAVRYPFEDRPGWTDAVVLAGVLVYTVCSIVAVPWPRALRHIHAVGFVVLPGLLGGGLYLAGAGALLGFDAWVVGLASFPLLVLAMARPLLPVLLLAVVESAVVTAAAVADPTISPLEVLAPITQTPMFVGLLTYGVGAVRRVRANADAEEQAGADAVARTQAAEARQRVIDTHYAWLLSDVCPFLDGVAAGALDIDDPAVQSRASVLALAIRDELALPARISAEVRQLIATARDRGVRVRARAIDEWSSVPPELAQILALLATGDRVTDITVSLPQASRPQLRVVVRPRLTPAQRAETMALLAHGQVEMSEDDLVSIITFAAAPRSEPWPQMTPPTRPQ